MKGSLEEFLIAANFNSFSFFYYLIHGIENDLVELRSYSGQLNNLYWNLKRFKQIQLVEKSYKLTRKSIKELLIEWINEEISYLEKSVSLEKLPISEFKESEDKELKLITDLSVPQLGFLLRLFLDTRLFKNKSHRAVATFFAKHTKTKGSSAISAGNLFNKFYDISGSVEEVVKGILIKLLNQIQQY